MANKWGIPKKIEEHVLKRDLFCVYCGVDFSINHESRKTRPTWEHIINDIRITVKENIALCCTSCNASKGAQLLEVWIESNYCKSKGVTRDNVAQVVKSAFLKPPTLNYNEEI